MGRKKKRQIWLKQLEKRKKKRTKLSKAGKNPNEYFQSGTYVSRPLK